MSGGKKNEELEPIVAAILRRNVNLSVNEASQEDVSSALKCLQIVRLDRERITKLSNLDNIEKAHSLYLQENQINKIENLEVLKNLQFLSLAENRIEKIQNLHCLQNLQFLDLSNNLIQNMDPGELPQNLLILNVSGNPCTEINGYRQQVLEALPHLQELDGVAVRVPGNQEMSDSEYEKEVSDSEDTSLMYEESDSLSSVAEDMLLRSHERRKRALREHEDRLEELNGGRYGQSLLPPKDEICCTELPENSHQNIDSKDKTSFQTNKQNTIKSNKEHRTAPLLEKNTSDLYKAGTLVFQNQTTASPTQVKSSVAVSTQRSITKSGTMSSRALPSSTTVSYRKPLSSNKVSSRALPSSTTVSSRTPSSSNTQTKLPQISTQSAGIKRVTTSSTLKERQTAKSIRHIPEKATVSNRSARSAPNPRQVASSKKT